MSLDWRMHASDAAPRYALYRTWSQVISKWKYEIWMRCLKELKVPGLEIAGSFEKLVVLEQANLAEPKSFYWNSISVELLILPGEIRKWKKEAVWTRRSRLRVGPSAGQVSQFQVSFQTVCLSPCQNFCMWWKIFTRTEWKRHPWTACLLEHCPAAGSVPALLPDADAHMFMI